MSCELIYNKKTKTKCDRKHVIPFLLFLRQWNQTQVQVKTCGTLCGTRATPPIRWSSCGKTLAMLAGKIRPRTAGSSSTGLLTATSGTVTQLTLMFCMSHRLENNIHLMIVSVCVYLFNHLSEDQFEHWTNRLGTFWKTEDLEIFFRFNIRIRF